MATLQVTTEDLDAAATVVTTAASGISESAQTVTGLRANAPGFQTPAVLSQVASGWSSSLGALAAACNHVAGSVHSSSSTYQNNEGTLSSDANALSSTASTVSTGSVGTSGGFSLGATSAGGAPSTASEQKLIADAKGWLGVPYVYGGTSRSGVDCSGFTQAVYAQMGISIGRDTAAQLRSGSVVGSDGNWAADVKDLQPGDLIFYGRPGAGGPNAHVVMYIGNGQVIQAPYTGQNVQISPLFSSASADEPFVGVRRYLPAAPVPTTGGPAASGNMSGWINNAIAATGVPASWAQGLSIIAQHESSGNPTAVNNTDINAQQGHPSEGLCQVIAPTFNSYALPGHTDILNPVDNTIAAIRYIQARYGSIDNVPGVRAVESGGSYVGY
ncbi:MAG: NlpC/P60 family protein [Actinomycetota bacterium]|nr:NlpC/P60 family protein [Actinomycetota bacterium]